MCVWSCSVLPEQRTAQTLKGILQERALTYTEVARAVDRPEKTVSRWVNGTTPQPANQRQLVGFLNEHGAERGIAPLSIDDIWGDRG